MQMALVEWRSGHLREALENASVCLSSIHELESSEAIAFATYVMKNKKRERKRRSKEKKKKKDENGNIIINNE